MRRLTGAKDQHARALAAQALGFLAEDVERIGPFLALTGIDPAEIRQSAANPEFLAAVLQYVLEREDFRAEFAQRSGCSPEELDRARQKLAGAAWERDSA
jgi:Protein of unknown function (DUF3572)